MSKILLVDDAVFIRRCIRSILMNEGEAVEFLEASDGNDALQKFREHSPDLVVMDIQMPLCDGLTALKQMVSERPEAKVIMCSSLDDNATVNRAVSYGAIDFIFKPVCPDRLRQSIFGAIRRKQDEGKGFRT